MTQNNIDKSSILEAVRITSAQNSVMGYGAGFLPFMYYGNVASLEAEEAKKRIAKKEGDTQSQKSTSIPLVYDHLKLDEDT